MTKQQLHREIKYLSAKINDINLHVSNQDNIIISNARKVEEIAKLLANKLGHNIIEEDYIFKNPLTGKKEIKSRLALSSILDCNKKAKK